MKKLLKPLLFGISNNEFDNLMDKHPSIVKDLLLQNKLSAKQKLKIFNALNTNQDYLSYIVEYIEKNKLSSEENKILFDFISEGNCFYNVSSNFIREISRYNTNDFGYIKTQLSEKILFKANIGTPCLFSFISFCDEKFLYNLDMTNAVIDLSDDFDSLKVRALNKMLYKFSDVSYLERRHRCKLSKYIRLPKKVEIAFINLTRRELIPIKSMLDYVQEIVHSDAYYKSPFDCRSGRPVHNMVLCLLKKVEDNKNLPEKNAIILLVEKLIKTSSLPKSFKEVLSSFKDSPQKELKELYLKFKFR